MSSRASINFFNDEAIKDEHINWEKKNLGDGTIDWYIQSILYHIYNVILLNLTHVKAFQTTHNYSILIRCIITFFIHRQQFIFVNHVNTYFKPCILLITHKGLGKVATLQMDWKKTHAPSSWRMPSVWMELYIEKVINCGYFAHTKWVQKVRKCMLLTHQMNITLFEHAHFIKPQTLNLKPYHLLHNKKRFKCIEVNVGM